MKIIEIIKEVWVKIAELLFMIGFSFGTVLVVDYIVLAFGIYPPIHLIPDEYLFIGVLLSGLSVLTGLVMMLIYYPTNDDVEYWKTVRP